MVTGLVQFFAMLIPWNNCADAVVAFANSITPNTSAKLKSKRADLDFRRKGAVATLAV
jgi:hypothetical protein